MKGMVGIYTTMILGIAYPIQFNFNRADDDAP